MSVKIVVPLDGSAVSEASLPFATYMARRIDADILLLRVIEMPALKPTPVNGIDEIALARTYLETVRSTIETTDGHPHRKPLRVLSTLGYGDPAAEITDIAVQEGAAFIVQATHGRTALSRFIMGSVASLVVQNAAMPVIVIRPTDFAPASPLAERLAASFLTLEKRNAGSILVTLDGTPEAETILDSVVALARLLSTSVTLLHVIDHEADPGEIDPLSVAATGATGFHAAHIYLKAIQARIVAQGVSCAVAVRRDNGPVAETIETYAATIQPLLLALATHGRGHIGRVLFGSVAEAILSHASQPVLMVKRQSRGS